jgi:hypothetical protein
VTAASIWEGNILLPSSRTIAACCADREIAPIINVGVTKPNFEKNCLCALIQGDHTKATRDRTTQKVFSGTSQKLNVEKREFANALGEADCYPKVGPRSPI